MHPLDRSGLVQPQDPQGSFLIKLPPKRVTHLFTDIGVIDNVGLKHMEQTKSLNNWCWSQSNRKPLKHELTIKTLVSSWFLSYYDYGMIWPTQNALVTHLWVETQQLRTTTSLDIGISDLLWKVLFFKTSIDLFLFHRTLKPCSKPMESGWEHHTLQQTADIICWPCTLLSTVLSISNFYTQMEQISTNIKLSLSSKASNGTSSM